MAIPFVTSLRHQEDGVAEAHIWGTGLVVRTKVKSQLFTIADWTDHRVRKLADPSTFTCFAILTFGTF